MTGAWRLRSHRARLGLLFLRWLFQGTRLALLFGVAAIVVFVLVMAMVFMLLAVWPIVLLGVCVLLGGWALTRGHRPSGLPLATAPPGPLPLSPPAAALPPSVQERIDRIHQKATALAGSAGSSEDRYLVQSTLDDYLPGAVEAYRSLPPGSAEWPVTLDGRTGLQLLQDQLDLLERNLDAIAGHAWEQGAQRLLAHQRFLEERLGAGLTEDLDLPR